MASGFGLGLVATVIGDSRPVRQQLPAGDHRGSAGSVPGRFRVQRRDRPRPIQRTANGRGRITLAGANRFAGLARTGSETTQSAGWITARRERPGPAPPCLEPLVLEPGGFAVPLPAARPDRRRLLRVVGVGLVGIAVGVGATLAAHGLEEAPTAPPRSSASTCRPVVSPPRPRPRARPGVRAGARRIGPGGRAALPRGRAAGDAATAYGLLDRAGRSGTRRRPASSVPRPTGPWSRPCGSGASAPPPARADVTVTLSHLAAIDPFAGLVPARTVEVWRASRQDGRWRVAADPVSVRPAQRRPRPRDGDRLGPAPARL